MQLTRNAAIRLAIAALNRSIRINMIDLKIYRAQGQEKIAENLQGKIKQEKEAIRLMQKEIR